MALNLVTKDEYKVYAGINSTTSDTIIDLLIPYISKFVKNYCRRTFVDYVDVPLVEIHKGGSPFLLPLETPIINIISLEYSSDYGQTYTALVEFEDWAQEDDLIVPIKTTDFARAIRGYKLTYTAGYDDVPEDLRLAVLDLITYYRKNDGAVNALKHVNTTSMQIEYITDTALPSHIKRVIDLYVTDYS